MGLERISQVLLIVLIGFCALTRAFMYDLTFYVEQQSSECFYQPIDKAGVILEVDFQVIGGGDLDIDFNLRSPSGELLRSQAQRRMGSIQLRTPQPGDYEFCFDNAFSRMTPKLIFFELYTDFEDKSFMNSEREATLEASRSTVRETALELIEMTVEEIKTSLDVVKKNTLKCKTVQGVIRGFTKQDRSIMEANYSRVNAYSGVYLFVMVGVSVTQVVMIKRLFSVQDDHHMKMST